MENNIVIIIIVKFPKPTVNIRYDKTNINFIYRNG